MKMPLLRRPFLASALTLALASTAPWATALTQSIIEAGSEWRYLDTITNAANQAPPAIGGVTDWKAVNYNAAAAGSPWKTGRASFGYGDSGYGTTTTWGSDTNNKYTTTYFWKSFQLPENAVFGDTFNQIVLGLVRDDGLIVYINGVEVARQSMPAGPVNNQTLANAVADGDSETRSFPATYDGTILLPYPQTNTIAVEVHQINLTSSDLRFDLSMEITEAEPCFGDAKPGIQTRFNFDGLSDGTGIVHIRPELTEPIFPNYNFDDQDTEMNWRHAEPTGGGVALVTETEFVTGLDMGTRTQGVFGGTIEWNSEAIDTRNYDDLEARIKVQSVSENPSSWTAAERLELILRVSADGVTYTNIPWITISTTGGAQNVQWTDLFTETTSKRAIVPTNDTTPPLAGAGNWRTLSFNDTAWPTGTMGAGFENAAATSTPNYADLIDPAFDFKTELLNIKSALYMRCRFPSVADLGTYNRLQLRMRYDDGFVAYLNDQEVARKNFTGTPNSTSVASGSNADTAAIAWEDFDISAHLNKLNTNGAGQDNVLTIHALNQTNGSSDMLAWPMLRIGKNSAPSLTLASIDDGNATTFTEVTTEAFEQNGQPLIPAGTQSLRLRVNAVSASFVRALYFDDLLVTGTPTSGDDFPAWTQQRLPDPTYTDALRMPNADPDGDGFDNMLEYGFCTDPAVAARTTTNTGGQKLAIAPEVTVDPQGFVFCKFRLPTGDITGGVDTGFEVGDLNIRPQISFGSFEFPGGWQDGVLGVNRFTQVGTFEESDDGTGCAFVTCRTIQPIADTELNVFVRVRVGLRLPPYLKNSESNCTF